MKFDIVVGNPPYGMRTDYIHFKIMNSVLKFCTNKLVFIMPSKPITQQLPEEWYNMFKNAVCNKIEVVDKKVFENTIMDNTAIFYCDRLENPKNYCKKLDVDNIIYEAIDNEAHKFFLDKMKIEPIKISFVIWGKRDYDRDFKRFYEKSKDSCYYLNVNGTGNAKPGEGEIMWISGNLKDVGILDRIEEIDYITYNKKRKNIIECPTKEYGENLKKLLMNGFVLRYGLWLLQIKQSISQKQFKYVPDIDYTRIHNDEELLTACGFAEGETKTILDYLSTFDFSKSRNDTIRDYNP